MLTIYVLKCEEEKYYVGKSKNYNIRLNQHFNGDGSMWTKKYKSISVEYSILTNDSYDEDKITLQYMEKKGINNVRGGSFTRIILNDEQINVITSMIYGSNDKCFICGSSDHFVKDCKQKIIDGPCNCINSYFSYHRKSKCLLNNTLKFFENIQSYKT